MRLRQILASAFCLVASATMAQNPMMMPLPQDTAVKVGKLSNGLTYYVRHNEHPEHVANFYIAQRVGSIQEEEEQRGLAHFLEHMAFNGSEHFAGESLLDFTRRHGVQFGTDLNAYTSIDQTVYRVCNVPTKDQAVLDSCMLILKDWSNGLTLDSKEIDKERGVIHGEWAMRNSAQMRLLENALPALYPDSKYGVRLPIGLMSVVDNFEPKALRDYYHKWYRPDNQAIIVVGDIDVAHTVAQIEKLFGGIVVPEGAAQVVDEPVPDNTSAIYVSAKDKELTGNSVSLMMKQDALPDSLKNTLAFYVNNYMEAVASMMLNSRLQDLAQNADCPFTSASASIGTYLLSRTKDAFSLDAEPKEGKDMEALAAVYREAQRVKQYGFTATEYARAKSEFMSMQEKSYTNRNKIKNDAYGDTYRDCYIEHIPVTSEEFDYQVWSQIVPSIPVEAINAAMQQTVTSCDSNLVVMVFVQDKEGVAQPTGDDMKKVLDGVRAETLTAWVDNVKNEPLISELPTAGKIVSEQKSKTLDYTTLKLQNGAKVILKKTDYKDDEVRLSAFAKGGTNQFDNSDLANLNVFDNILGISGLGSFSSTELDKALAGKQVHAGLSLGGNYTYVRGTSTPKDIETMLQLVYLKFTAVNKDEKAFATWMEQMRLQLKNWETVPTNILQDSLSSALYNGNPRYMPMHYADLEKVSYDKVLQMKEQAYADPTAFTYVFTGNFDETTLRPLIEQYIGSLKPTGKMQQPTDRRDTRKGQYTCDFKRKMESPKPYVFEFLTADMSYTLENKVLMSALSQVLSIDLLKSVREDAGAAYSIGAAGNISIGPDQKNDSQYALLQVYAPISDPTKVDLSLKLIDECLGSAEKSISSENVEKVKSTMLKKFDVNQKNNTFWENAIENYEIFGIDNVTPYQQLVNGITTAKLVTMLKQINSSGNIVKVVMRPE